MPFPCLAAINVVYSFMKRGETESVRDFLPRPLYLAKQRQIITHLSSLISHMYQRLTSLLPNTTGPLEQMLRIPRERPCSPIFALLTPKPRSLAKHCQAAGFMVRAIVPPTVPEGTQRVRVCLHAGNTTEDIDRLVEMIRDWLELAERPRKRNTAEFLFEKALL